MDLAGLDYSKIYTFVTPRRLSLIVKGLSNSSNSYYEEKRGPRVGSPEKAIEGFTRSLNIDKSSLFIKKEKKGNFISINSIKKEILQKKLYLRFL